MKGVIRLSAALLMAAACGDDDGGGGGGVDSGKKLGDLSEAELTNLCKSVDKRFDSFGEAVVSFTCTAQALIDPDTCEATRTECIEEADPDDALGDENQFECGTGTDSIDDSCAEITVGELNACMDAIIKMVKSAADGFTCSKTDPPELTSPPACAKLQDRCPELADFGEN